MSRKYYSVLVCQKNKPWCLENLNRIVDGSLFVFGDDTIQRGVYDEVEVGDILLLNYQERFTAYAEVTARHHMTDEEEWNQVISTKPWVLHNTANREIGVSAYGIAWNIVGGGTRGLVKEIEPAWAFNRIREINNNDTLYKTLEKEMTLTKDQIAISQVIDVLKGTKPQVILQGPPGTGKTRLAKLVAKQLAAGHKIDSPMRLVDMFFKDHDANSEEAIESAEKDEALLKKFTDRFPVSSLRTLATSDYAQGHGNRDNFCWWIETGLKSLGKYSPGNSTHYLLYWSKGLQSYSKHGNLTAGLDDADAMSAIAGVLADVVEQKSLALGTDHFGESFLLKLLNSYFPDEFFPINGRAALDSALSVFGVDGAAMTKAQKNTQLNELFLAKRAEYKSSATAFDFMRFLFQTFDPNSGKMYNHQEELIQQGEYKIVQFHPAYSYEDFVRGIAAVPRDKGIVYEVQNRILTDFAAKAIANPSASYILVLDEINRANLPAVLGELIYSLEYRYDENEEADTVVQGMYSYSPDHENVAPSHDLCLPANLYIIGTMNTADRSVGHIDYAIRRRFGFIDITADKDAIKEAEGKKLFEKVERLFTAKGANGLQFLSTDFDPQHVQLGHSYFMAKGEALQRKLKYEIVPILREYIRDGILLPEAATEIEILSV